MEKIECIVKILVCLTGKAHNHVYAYRAMRYKRLDKLNPVGVQLALVTSSHQRQYLIATALQGNMKMRHKTGAGSHLADDRVGKQVGLDGGNAVTFRPITCFQCLHQPGEILPSLNCAGRLILSRNGRNTKI